MIYTSLLWFDFVSLLEVFARKKHLKNILEQR